MSLTIHILYTGKEDNARKFAEEMISTGLVASIRQEKGNEMYAYYYPIEDSNSVLLIDRWENQQALDQHHQSDRMKKIADLRKKYQLKMHVTRFREID